MVLTNLQTQIESSQSPAAMGSSSRFLRLASEPSSTAGDFEDSVMRIIPLTQGKVAFVDDADFEWLSNIKWHVAINRRRKTTTFYAQHGSKALGRLSMHRLIVGGLKPGDEVDHKNGNGLDNQRHNLRVASRKLNLANQKMRFGNTSGFKGVRWYAGKWVARIKCDGTRFHLGRFVDIKDAARAYDAKAMELYGEFARTNKSMGLL